MRIEAFCPKRSVERFHKGIIRWFSWSGKRHSHSVLIGPQIHRLTGKLAPIVTVQKLRNSTLDFDAADRRILSTVWNSEFPMARFFSKAA